MNHDRVTNSCKPTIFSLLFLQIKIKFSQRPLRKLSHIVTVYIVSGNGGVGAPGVCIGQGH